MSADPQSTENRALRPQGLSPAASSARPAISGLGEDAALALLHTPEVTAEALSQLARDQVVAKSRKVLFALVAHPRTPRHISIPLLRRMFTFDLVQVTLTPAVAADVKRSAEEQIILRLESLPAGQKISLARRASGRIAGQLLQNPDVRVITPALENPQLTESLIIQALMKKSAPAVLFKLASEHAKWSLRREIQIALLKSGKISPQRVAQFAKNFSPDFLRRILRESPAAPPSIGN